MFKIIITLICLALPLAAQIVVINSGDTVSGSRATINSNYAWLEAEKLTYLGAYSAGTTYAKSAVVADGGVWYVSLQGSNTGQTPASSPSYWVAIPGSGGGGGALVREYKAAVCQSAAGSLALNAASGTAPSADCDIGSSGVIYGYAAFANGATVYAVQDHLYLPASLTSASADIEWATTATSGSAVWQLQTACVADNESTDATFNTAQTVTSAAKASAGRRIAANIASVTLTGCAAGEKLFWRLFRDPAHASDDLAATAKLISIKFTVQ